MVAKLFSLLAAAIIDLITRSGYLGIVLLMGIESACIPLPSEVIMPFAGYLVFKGTLVLWIVVLAGAIGCVLGSLLAYAVGAWGGRRLVERYGKYVLVSRRDLDLADRWFREHGGIIIFVGRVGLDDRHAVHLANVTGRETRGDQLRNPRLHVAVLNTGEGYLPPARQNVRGEHRVVKRAGRRLETDLSADPLFGQAADGQAGARRIDVATGLHGGRNTVQPCLGIDLPREVTGVLVAR